MNDASITKVYLCRTLLSPVVTRRLLLPLAALGGLLVAGNGSAQENLPQISAKRFLRHVAESNPTLALREAELGLATARATASGLWENPSLAYEREEVFTSGRGAPESIVRLEIPLEISGRRWLRVEGAEQGVSAARADAAATRVAVLANAMRVYLGAAAWRDRLIVLEHSREVLAKLRAVTSVRRAAGDASGYDLTRIEIEVSCLDDLIAETQRELARARLRIGMLLGQPGAKVDAADALTTAGLRVPTGDTTQPRILAAQSRVNQHRLDRDAAARGWVPALALSGGAKTTPLAGNAAWGYVAGIAVTLPVFNFGQAEKEKAHAELRRARAGMTVIEHRIATEVAMAKEELGRTLRQVQSFERDQLPRLERLMRRAEISYQEGERPVSELIDAHRTAREVRLRHVRLKGQAQLSHIALLEALGREPGGNP